MYNRILVPLDGSPLAEAILPYVVDLASRYKSTVVLMRVIEVKIGIAGVDILLMPGILDLMVKEIESDRHDSENYLNSIKTRLMAKGLKTKIIIVFGPVINRIILTAKEEKADLIAMASHGATGASCMIYGSVALGVLRHMDRPMLIVRSQK